MDESLRLAQGYRELRERLRRDFPKNVRTNNTVVGYSLEFIEAFLRIYPQTDRALGSVKQELKAERD